MGRQNQCESVAATYKGIHETRRERRQGDPRKMKKLPAWMSIIRRLEEEVNEKLNAESAKKREGEAKEHERN